MAAGHDVVIGGRSADKATAIADRAGARALPLDQAWRDAEVVVLSVLYQGVAWTLEAAEVTGDALRGRVLLDVNNPVEVDGFRVVGDFRPSLAEHLAATTGAHVVKALHQVEATVFSSRAAFGGAPMVVPVATDSARAVRPRRRRRPGRRRAAGPSTGPRRTSGGAPTWTSRGR